jgi:hypothetical protein
MEKRGKTVYDGINKVTKQGMKYLTDKYSAMQEQQEQRERQLSPPPTKPRS